MNKHVLKNSFDELFDDLNLISEKEARKELNNFRRGTAPQNPSFLVNQKNVQKKILKILKDCLDGLGMGFLVIFGNTGDGKTHILHTIASRLSRYQNIMVKKFYIRDEGINLFKVILQQIDKLFLKEMIVEDVKSLIINDEIDDNILNIYDKLGVSNDLARILYYIVAGNIGEKIEAIAILTGQIKNGKYIDGFGDVLEQTFYAEVLNYVNKLLNRHERYIIVLFDEFEHVMDWLNEKQQRQFFRNLKELLDYADNLSNIVLFFAATEIYKGEVSEDLMSIMGDVDPALYERFNGAKEYLNIVFSDDIIKSLVKKILHLFEQANVKKDIAIDDVFEEVKARISKNKKPSYRNICQVIVNILDQIEDVKKDSKDKVKIEENNIDKLPEYSEYINKLIKKYKKDWVKLPSAITQKSVLIESFEALFKYLNYEVSDVKKSKGWIYAKGFSKQGYKHRTYRLFAIAYTSKKNNSFIKEKFKSALKEKEASSSYICYFFYPDYACSKEIQFYMENYNPAGIVVMSMERDDIFRLQLFLENEEDLDKKYLLDLAKEFAAKFELNIREE